MSKKTNELDSSKTIIAKEFCDKVVNKELEPDEETISNFISLFSVLGLVSDNFVDEETA